MRQPTGYFGLISGEPFPTTDVKTREKFAQGSENGIHITKLIPQSVVLDICQSYNKPLCNSCFSRIKFGDLVGDGRFRAGGLFCANCVHVPKGVEGWQISYKMRRRSKQNGGVKQFTMVAKPACMKKYLRSVFAIHGDLQIVKLWPMSAGEIRQILYTQLDNMLGAEWERIQDIEDLTDSLLK